MTSTIGGLETTNIPKETISQELPKQNVEPVRPTLDSILNGTPATTPQNTSMGTTEMSSISTPMEARPIMEEPVVEPIPSVTPVLDTPVVDTSASSNEVFGATPSVSQIESIPEIQNVNIPTPQPSLGENPNVLVSSPGETLESSISSLPNGVKAPTLDTNLNSSPSTSPIMENGSVETLDVSTLPVGEGANVEPISSMTPTPQDDFGAVPVPPVFDDGKKKKEKKERKKGDSRKTMIVVLLIILVAAIGFGVYYFLSIAKASANKASIVLKDVKLELGNTMSSTIDDYATITGYDKANCTIDLSSVDVNKVSTYKYQVTCGKVTEEGTLIVDDSIAPKVTTQDVVLLPNATLNAEDFIEKCSDASSCSYKFAEDYTGITEKVGEYEIQLVVSDNFNNESKVSAKLTVAKNAPVKYITCVSKEETLEDIPAMLVHSYRIGVDAKDNFFQAVRTSLFTYTTLEDYNQAVRNYDASLGIHGIIGTEILSDAEKSIAIKTDKTLKDMNQDVNGNLPENASILRAYLSGIGYTCN